MTILRAYSSLIPQAMEMLRNAPEVFINKEFTGFQMDLYLVPQRFESVLVPCLNHDKFDHVTEINFTFPRENNCRVWNYWLSADTLKISHCSKHRALPGGNRTSLSVTQNNISSHSLSKKMIIEILTKYIIERLLNRIEIESIVYLGKKVRIIDYIVDWSSCFRPNSNHKS